MPRRVPEPCVQFLEHVRDAIVRAVTKRSDVRPTIGEITLVGNHALSLSHPLAKELRCVFRYVDETDQMVLNVECIPRQSLGISHSLLKKALAEADLRGAAQVDDKRLVFSLAWGHESQAHQLIDGSLLAQNLTEFAVSGTLAMMDLLRRYGEPTILEEVAMDAGGQQSVSEQLRLAAERHLENLIVEQWDLIDFGSDLKFVDRQVSCGEIGVIDILARDRATHGYVVIELKRDQGDDEAFGQLARYMGWVAENMDQPEGIPVGGIIIAAEITAKLEAAAQTNPNVRLVEYAVKLALSPKERADGD